MSSKNVPLRLLEIIENAERIITYTGEINFETYRNDHKTKDAVERCFSRISEAAYKIGDYVDAMYPDADWRGARGIGNILRHGYDKVADESIFEGARTDIPTLKKAATIELARLYIKDLDKIEASKKEGLLSFSWQTIDEVETQLRQDVLDRVKRFSLNEVESEFQRRSPAEYQDWIARGRTTAMQNPSAAAQFRGRKI